MVRKLIPDVVRNQNLLILPPGATVREAVLKMAERDVRSVLVVGENRLLGIFTGTDLISRVVGPGLDPNTATLEQVMTKNPRTVEAHDNAIEALRLMQFCRCRHLPVMHQGALAGILSRRDFYGDELSEIERQEKVWEEL